MPISPSEAPSLADELPKLREMFCDSDNQAPLETIAAGSHQKFWFSCPKCGDKRLREFRAVVAALRRGTTGCGTCYRKRGGISAVMETRNQNRIKEKGSLADNYPNIAEEWDHSKNNRRPDQYLSNSGHTAHWICRAGHSWRATINSRVKAGTGCRKCGHHISQYEKRVVVELRALGFDAAWNERLFGVECDILLFNQKVALEVDGFPWHESIEAYRRELRKEAILHKNGFRVIRWRCSLLTRRRPRAALYHHERDNSNAIKELFQVMLSNGEFTELESRRIRAYCESSAGYVAEDAFQQLHKTTATELFRGSMAEAYPHLIGFWSPRNLPLTPHQVSKGTKRKVWWKCASDPNHEWQARPSDRRRYGCPRCNGNVPTPEDNFYVNHQNFCDTYATAHTSAERLSTRKTFEKLLVRCVNAHDFELGLANLIDRRRGDNQKTFSCKACPAVMPYDGTPLVKDPRKLAVLSKYWHNEKNEFNPLYLVANQRDRYWWRCPEGHAFHQTLSHMFDLRYPYFRCTECGQDRKHLKQ